MGQFEFEGKNNPRIQSTLNSEHSLKLYMTKKELQDYEVFCNFINSVKSLVRKDPRYTNYKAYLFSLGLNRCQIFSDITDEMAPIEMHHGPIFTLFDICSIVSDHLLSENKFINSFIVADHVLTEHEKSNIQIVMLSETGHEAAENGSHFLSFKQGFGNLHKFLKRYKGGIRKEHVQLMKEYLKLSKENDATDNGVFDIVDRIKKYAKK